MIKIYEKHDPTDEIYYYVVDGKELKHISSYAISTNVGEDIGKPLRAFDLEPSPIVTIHEVPREPLLGKKIIVFSHSIRPFPRFAEEWKVGKTTIDNVKKNSWEWRKPLEDLPDELREYEFSIEDRELRKLMDPFDDYILMKEEVADYSSKMEFKIYFGFDDVSLKIGIEEFFKDPDVWRFKSFPSNIWWTQIGSTYELIYKLWILKLLSEAAGTRKFVHAGPSGTSYLWKIEQGNFRPACILDTPNGPITCYFECRDHGLFEKGDDKEVHVRPDIVAVKGYKKLDEISKADLLIWCQNAEFEKWGIDPDLEIPARPILDLEIPARPILGGTGPRSIDPRSLTVASLKRVPSILRGKLESMGLNIIDEVKPENPDGIERFKKSIRKFLE